MNNMIKFLRGNVANLPQTATPGALYFTKDEGVYIGLDNGSYHRYGDFITVENVSSLPAAGAHETCMYYCVSENILARYDSVKGWIQINKQPTAEELKGLLGLGSLAYLSEVSEDNLNSALKEKVNAAAEGNHSHSNKALLDTYTQTEENLADAVAKKHAHTFNETELNKIVEGDVAKWNAAEGNAKAYADEKIGALDYTDTAVEGEYVSAVNEVDGKISVTRKALPDYTNVYEAKGEAAKVQGELNTYKEANDIALANVKATAEAAYVKPATGIAKDDLSAEVKTSLGKADTALQSHQDISHLAVKSDVETELGKKVDKTTYEGKIGELETAINGKVEKVEGKSLVLDTEIAKLAGVSEGANKVEGSTVNGKIKIDGVETVVYVHPEKHTIAEVDGLQGALDGKQAAGNYSLEGHKHVKEDITDFAHTHVASEITDLDGTIKGYDYATKTEAQGYANAKDGAIAEAKQAGLDAQTAVGELETYVGTFTASEGVDTVVKYIDAKTANIASDERVSGIENRVKAIEDDYLVEADKTELAGLITAEKERALGIEGGLETRLAAVEGDYLKGSDKTELEGKITANANAIELLTNGVSAEEVDGVNDLIQYVKDHGTEVTGMKGDIKANSDAIAAINNETTGILVTAKGYADGLNGAMDTRVKVLEGINHEAYIAADTALKTEVNGYADGKVKELADGQVKTNTEEIAKKANSADVYAKTETYTQAEIQALLTWGEF